MPRLNPEPPPLGTIRALLAWSLLAGSTGTLVELLLIGHIDMTAQRAPLVLLAAGILVSALAMIAPRAVTIRTLQLLMVVFVGSGILGVILHYQGNEAFELEMSPSRAGMSLISKTLTGATPVLAPGSMSLLGFVGLAFSYRHPALRSQAGMSRPKEEQA